MPPSNSKGELFRSEFALVRVSKDHSANGERLLIEDMSTGNRIYLDPLELEALTRMNHDVIRPFVPAPSATIPPDDIGL
jgi:hypothetical protein